MPFVVTDVKGILTIKLKSRHDTLSDQYNRIFMVKILLACTVITGISWYKDKINCLIPPTVTHSKDGFPKFVSSSCWINGVYVYKQLEDQMRRMSFYGVPKDINFDGIRDGNKLCRMKDRFHDPLHKDCVEMDKTFYLQYQYLPFYICAMALLYYLPYLVHKKVNHDVIRLSEVAKKKPDNASSVMKVFFKRVKLQKRKCFVSFQQVGNILIKILYVLVNVLAFYGTNRLFNGDFYNYGVKWVHWAEQNNTMRYDYMGKREEPKPSNQLLPAFGFCDVYSQAKDQKHAYSDHHKLVCELSQHILYHYAFFLLWFAIIVGIVVSVVGVVLHLIKYLKTISNFCDLYGKDSANERIYELLSYRQLEYLEFLRQHNVILHGEVMKELAVRRREYDDQRGIGRQQ